MESTVAPFLELKFAGDSGEPGEFSGYGSFFNEIDSHRDIVKPEAFLKTLDKHRSDGTMPGMYVEHGQYSPFGPPPLPVGVWTEMKEDGKGLFVKGKLSGLDTDDGRKLRSLMQDGAIRGLSIAYSVPAGGAIVNKQSAGEEAKRILKEVNLDSVDLVRSPSNKSSRVLDVKSVLAIVDRDTAVKALGDAIVLHRATMSGSDSPDAEERKALLNHLQEAYRALTGKDEPTGGKSAPKTIREFETMLREEFGFTNTQARSIAETGFKSSLPRDEEGEKAAIALKAATDEIGASLKGFSLPTF